MPPRFVLLLPAVAVALLLVVASCATVAVSAWTTTTTTTGAAIGRRRATAATWATSTMSTSCCSTTTRRQRAPLIALSSTSSSSNDDKGETPKGKKKKKKKSGSNKKNNSKLKEELVKAVGERMRQKRAQQQQKTKKAMTKKKDDEVVAADAGETTKVEDDNDGNNVLDKLNPFKAGQSLRQSIDTALTSISTTLDQEEAARRSKFYLDDRLTGGSTSSSSVSGDGTTGVVDDEFVPEVLVVGASGAVGRRVVKRLLLGGRSRVRVLVRNLYTRTLDLLGTGVTYCQGDLQNADSLEYAVTDVDKIVFCAAPPRTDEDGFRRLFQEYVQEITTTGGSDNNGGKATTATSTTTSMDDDWDRLERRLEVQAQLAEQVDCVGMQNLVRAYQNVRHADYGTSQAAKRSLFKFQDRPEDFNLFAVESSTEDDDDNDYGDEIIDDDASTTSSSSSSSYNDADDEEYDDDEYGDDDDYEDYYDKYDDDDDDGYGDGAGELLERRRDATVRATCQWKRNAFEHGVFVGKVPVDISTGGGGGEATLLSSRLRSRQDPENGIDLSAAGFAGFIARLCSDGGVYEAIIRTAAYNEAGIEYTCPFTTATKSMTGGGTASAATNKSVNKFTTVRLPFERFTPVLSKNTNKKQQETMVSTPPPPFRGRDVRYIGFRYRSASNLDKKTPSYFMNKNNNDESSNQWSSFYLALSYIKLYRAQPEPEFVYLSDARIPPVVRSDMVRHDMKQLVPSSATATMATVVGAEAVSTTAATGGGGAGAVKILDESALKAAADTNRRMGLSVEETYYKYRGEEILKQSGLSYAIVRVPGYNENPSGEASTIELRGTTTTTSGGGDDGVQNDDATSTTVSRDEVAQVCVSALMDPAALNKSFYMGKKKKKKMSDAAAATATATTASSLAEAEDMHAKFQALPPDQVA